ncbi:MAG: CusA/CzcA family heavy metal efflux RND transporter [Pirellulaceae bacterium]|nr:CusA/CzcA family heavy metal efflux RND transporter [Pirellulaceae bacterium]
MLNHVIAFCLKNRVLVLALTVVLVIYGSRRAAELPIDVFPDLNRPTVTIMVEAHGLAPEEVETLVTFPIESAMNGASDVLRVRSASGIGLSIVWVEFDWGTDIYVNRQIVAEKLQLIRERLPEEVRPVVAPISSIMGEIMLLGMKTSGETTPMELRTIADWEVRQRLLAVPGVSQVSVMGGELKQYQVLTSPEQLARHDVTLDELTAAVEKSNVVTGGGFLLSKTHESLIRIIGRATTLDEVADTVVRAGDPVPITVRQVADVRYGGPVRRGDASIGGEPSIILAVQKQPGADTLVLTGRIDRALADIQQRLPAGVAIATGIFRQADFIETAIDNVKEAIRDGVIWVVVVLFLFLANLRTSLITLSAIPLSIIITALAFSYFGVSVNTMTLGGLAVAIGELVDDSIVDIENIFRRLKENNHKPAPDNPLRVVFLASCEVRNSIVYATLIVVLVVLPLFSLVGLEGRMFAPLGLAYLTTLLASLVVSLTVTPVLASYLLPRAKFLKGENDPVLLRGLKWADRHLLRFTLRHSTAVLVVVAILMLLSVSCIAWMGGEFLPRFNEGSLTIAAMAPPGVSMEESNRIAKRIELMLMDIPEVKHVSRRTGRAELDEHAENVNFSEIDVGLMEPERPKPGIHFAVLRAIPGLHRFGVDIVGRPRDAVMAEIRDIVAEVPGVKVNIGQPISHRLDHMMSGIRSQIAVKLYGRDLEELRDRGQDIAEVMAEIPGVVDLQIEPQVDIPQVRVTILRQEAARYGLAPADVAKALETALQGRTVSQVLEGQRVFDLIVWFDEEARNNIDAIRATLISTPDGSRVALGSVADVEATQGPNTINRENVRRRIVMQCNTAGRDLVSVVRDIQAAVDEKIEPLLQDGYFVEYGGQFEARQDANRRLLLLGSLATAAIFLLLYKCLASWQAALQVMVNIPQAAMGSVIALLLVNRPAAETLAEAAWWEVPGIWIAATDLSVAHWVGFITLIGIVSRNGIMMISHYIHLMKYEGEVFGERMIIRGSLERLAPVLMTALTTMIGLVPLAMGAGQTGKEILHPLAVVVIGGLLMSTLLDQIVTPALFFKFGRRVYESSGGEEDPEISGPSAPLHLAGQFR